MKTSGLRIDQSADYRICVQGTLGDNWSDFISGITITHRSTGAEQPVTTIHGQVKDQAELIAMLTALYDLRLPVLSVECLSCAHTT